MPTPILVTCHNLSYRTLWTGVVGWGREAAARPSRALFSLEPIRDGPSCAGAGQTSDRARPELAREDVGDARTPLVGVAPRGAGAARRTNGLADGRREAQLPAAQAAGRLEVAVIDRATGPRCGGYTADRSSRRSVGRAARRGVTDGLAGGEAREPANEPEPTPASSRIRAGLRQEQCSRRHVAASGMAAGWQGPRAAPCPTSARYWIWKGEPAPPPIGSVVWFGVVGGCTPSATSLVRTNGAAAPSGSSVRYSL